MADKNNGGMDDYERAAMIATALFIAENESDKTPLPKRQPKTPSAGALFGFGVFFTVMGIIAFGLKEWVIGGFCAFWAVGAFCTAQGKRK